MSKKKDSLKPWLSRPAINRSVTLPLTRPLTQRLSNLNEFHPNELNPYLLFDTRDSMLGELESPALFLDSVPLLKNLADPSGATDAVQATATNQPTALPLIDNEGYCYFPPVVGNYASTPDDSSLDITGDITIECDFIVPQFPLGSSRSLVAKYNTSTDNRSYSLIINASGDISLTLSEDGTYNPAFQKGRDFSSVLSGKTRATVKVTWRQSDGLTQFFIKDEDGSFTQVSDDQTIAATSIYNGNQEVEIGSTNSGFSNIGSSVGVFGARIYASDDGTDKRLDVDFTAPNVRHGATKFKCATGQVVTINQSGNNPASIIKKSVLRFDGVDDFMDGVFGQTLTGGYMFAAFSVNGSGGETSGRVFSVNSTGSGDSASTGAIFSFRTGTSNDIRTYASGAYWALHPSLFSQSNGDILHESVIKDGFQLSQVNNADEGTFSDSTTLSSEEFNISATENGDTHTAIDLEYLALFPASITDSQADAVRNYINNRNNVFDLKDGFGYYFFDPQSLADGAVTSWNGRIVGSDNGDVDKLATQATAADQPTSDGYKVTFADSTDHLEIPSTTQAGWQVVGTSLGTFVYKVDSDAITELNLLGNLGSATYRQAGDLYGIILLPENATNRDINEAKRLLIDRGAADGTTASNYFAAWYNRDDIVNFGNVDFTSATNMQSAFQLSNSLSSFNVSELPSAWNLVNTWKECTSLTSFSTKIPSATNCGDAWAYCSSLSDFRTTDIKNCSAFGSAWRNCSSLTQFPPDAKLGTEASNVNFSNAWKASGLTSFSTPLPTATSVTSAWNNCSSLTSFSTELPLVTTVYDAWLNCSSLTDFSADVFANWNPSSISSGVFNDTWDGCTLLTAQSVENILVSIDASGKYATTTGVSGGPALADAGIDIDYDGTTLSAATNAAVTSLKSKGWSIIVNNVTL